MKIFWSILSFREKEVQVVFVRDIKGRFQKKNSDSDLSIDIYFKLMFFFFLSKLQKRFLF